MYYFFLLQLTLKSVLFNPNRVLMCIIGFSVISHFRNDPQDLVAARDPDVTFITGRLWSSREYRWSHSAEDKQGKCCWALHFLVGIVMWRQRLFRVLLTSAASPATVLSAHTRSHTQTQKLCVIAKGTSWFRARPGRRAHKAMGTAGHRREDEQSSAEMWRAEGWN